MAPVETLHYGSSLFRFGGTSFHPGGLSRENITRKFSAPEKEPGI